MSIIGIWDTQTELERKWLEKTRGLDEGKRYKIS